MAEGKDMWHVFTLIDWRSVFNAVLVGMGGLSVWVFKYHYQRFMATHDLQKKADAEWRRRVDRQLRELRIACNLDTGSYSKSEGKGNGVHRAAPDRNDVDDDGIPDT